MKIRFSKLFLEKGAEADPLVSRLLESTAGIRVETVDDARRLVAFEPEDRNSLVLMRRRGAFVKQFPTTPDSPPCGEKYIVTMLNCPYSCTYCYLQSYLGHGRIVLFSNTEEMKKEVAGALAASPPPRLTTGELGDSLALDHLTGTTAELLPLFRKSGSFLEVRTKSSNVDHLFQDTSEEGRDGAVEELLREKLIATWSLGPEEAIEREEPGTAELSERLRAMKRVSRRGVRVGVRFDPIIPFYADLEEYRTLVEKIAGAVETDMLYRFELGVLRFPPGLWEKTRDRHPRSVLTRGEFLKDGGGRMRLYRPRRVTLYREIARIIHSVFPGTAVELSMESRSAWEDAGLKPQAAGQRAAGEQECSS